MPDIEILILAKDEASRTMKGVGKNMLGLSDNAVRLGILGVGALAGVGAAVGKLAYDAAQVEPIRITFQNLAEDIGTTSDALLDELRPAVMHTLSDLELMQSTNKLMAMGLAGSTEEAAKLSEIAVTLGTAMGVDATTSLENFSLMLANLSIPRLDTFGISAANVRTRIKELMEATEGMTREEAFMIATMAEAELSMKRVGDVSDTAAVRMGAFRAKVTNAKDELADALLPVLETVLDDAIGPLIDKLADDLIPLLAEHLPGAIEGTISAFRTLGDLIGNILEGIQALEAWTAEHLAAPEMRGWAGRGAVGQATAESPLYGGWAGRAEINVYGLPGLEEEVRRIIEDEGGRTGGVRGP